MELKILFVSKFLKISIFFHINYYIFSFVLSKNCFSINKHSLLCWNFFRFCSVLLCMRWHFSLFLSFPNKISKFVSRNTLNYLFLIIINLVTFFNNFFTTSLLYTFFYFYISYIFFIFFHIIDNHLKTNLLTLIEKYFFFVRFKFSLFLH